MVGLVSGFLQFQLFVSNWNCHKLLLPAPAGGWVPAAIGLSVVSFLSKTNFDPGQHYSLATVDIVMSSVKFKKGKICTVLVMDHTVMFSLKDSRAKAKVGEETKDDVTVEETEQEEVILFKLSDEDIEFIYDNTHYSLKDINDWHR